MVIYETYMTYALPLVIWKLTLFPNLLFSPKSNKVRYNLVQHNENSMPLPQGKLKGFFPYFRHFANASFPSIACFAITESRYSLT